MDQGQRSPSFEMEPQEAVEANGVESVEHTPAPTAEKNPSAVKKASWKTKCLVLKRKCDQIDQSNDVLYAKSRQIYKMIQRTEREKKVLMHRLEQYEVEVGEKHGTNSSVTRLKMTEWLTPPPSFSRSAFTSPTPDPSETDFVQNLRQDMARVPSPSPTAHLPAPPLPPLTSLPAHTTTDHHHQPPPSKKSRLSTPTPTSAAATKPTKRTPKGAAKRSPASRRKKNVDTSAPKKPSNAFFWFCQEQRGSLEEQFRGEGVAGQHSLTKILAQKWGETNTDDREKYYLRYTEDKKRYEREMQAYHQKKQQQQEMLEKQLQQQLSAADPPPST